MLHPPAMAGVRDLETDPGGLTKDRILDAAERLFARDGVDAVSLRQIMREVGVNTGAIHYHFRSKQNLVLAVADRQIPRVAERRLRLLARCSAEPGRRPLVEQIVDAFVRPSFPTLVDDGSPYGKQTLAAMTFQSDGLTQRMYTEQFLAADRRFIEALTAALPGTSPATIYWRYAALIAAVIYAVSGGLRVRYLSRGLYDPADVARAIDEIVTFYGAAFAAPAPDVGARKPAASKATISATALSGSPGS